jgi:hypothetical protein
MAGTKLPDAPIAVALHDRALETKGASPSAFTHCFHTLTIAQPSARWVAVAGRAYD